MGGMPVGPLKPACLTRRKDYGRYHHALLALNHICGWEMADYLEGLRVRVIRGVLQDLVWLCRFKGMTGRRARYLIEHGVKEPSDLADILPSIEDEIDDSFREVVQYVQREICGTSD